MQIQKHLLDKAKESEFHKRLFKIPHSSVVIDNSTYNEWDGCPVKGLWLMALRRRRASKADALSFGTGFHKAMESLAYGRTREEAIRAGVEACRKEGLTKTKATHPDALRTLDRLAQVIIDYDIHWGTLMDMLPPIEINGQPMIEQSFAIPANTISIDLFPWYDDHQPFPIQVVWTGKIDRITSKGDDLWLVDHKTTTVMGARFADDLQRSSQMLGYMMAGRHLCNKLGIDPKRLKGVIIDAAALRKAGNDFERFEIPLSDWAIHEWKTEMLVRLTELCTSYVNAHTSYELPATRSHCVTKYGKCEYFEVCQSHPALRARYLESGDFYDDTWDPLADEKEAKGTS